MKQESFQIGVTTDKDTTGARFYRLLSTALELDETYEEEEGDRKLWEMISSMSVLAWNLSFEEGIPSELLRNIIAEFKMEAIPETFQEIMLNIIADRRAIFPDEKNKIQECMVEEGRIMVMY